MSTTTLVSLSGAKDRAAFVEAFQRAQVDLRKDPYRVGLWPLAVTQAFVEMPLPFAREFFVAEGPDGTPTGRIGASVSPVHEGLGYVGFFEAVGKKTAEELLEAAVTWLRAQSKVTRIVGPVNYNTWFAYRFRLDGDKDSEHFEFEPGNPPDYPRWFEALGFQRLETYHSQAVAGLSRMAEATGASLSKATAAGYTFRRFDSARLLDHDVPTLHRLSMAGFKDAFLFEPIPVELFRALYVPVAAKKLDLSLCYFALEASGREVGFVFNFIDQGYFVIKSIVLLPEARGQGVSNAMLHLAASEAHARGVSKSIGALMQDGNPSEALIRKDPPLWTHRYALYQKELGAG
jgi:GNAT superfamily N-acetyltransferase